MSDRRRFNGHERAALYLAADGCCARCGVELTPGWHADHEKPWSYGGSTDVINGQALCPTCNLKKGNKTDMDWREWQKQAKRQYIADGKKDWLAYVTPGGGKTKWALSVASDLLQDNVVQRVVVVVPTDGIRIQWMKQGDAFEIPLAIVSNSDGGIEGKDFRGQVVTYAQVASMPELYRRGCGRFKTLVIFDECHHAGDSQSWGQAIEQAFLPAVRRISMTGTPWRAPKRGKIPFVPYNFEGEVTPDFRFTYREAVQHGVCRPIQFYAFDGEVTYVNVDSCAPQLEVIRLGEADDDDNSRVLRDILRADGKWMASILRQAVRTLDEMRSGENEEGTVPDGKGLVQVHDRYEARAVMKVLERITHECPALIISDPEPNEPNPQEELERFRKDQRKWAVAVDMVAEGVDIPSLYVGVYATRKKTPLRFQQSAGRFVRQRPGDVFAAVLFIPAVPSILALASAIENDLLHVMDEEIEEERRTRQKREDDMPSETLIRTTSDAEFYSVISEGNSYSDHEMRKAKAYCEEFGIPSIHDVKIAKMLRALGPAEPKVTTTSAPTQASPERMTKQEEQRTLRQLLNRETGRAAAMMAKRDGIEIGQAKIELNAKLQRMYHKHRKDMTIADLREAIAYVKSLREEKVES